MAESSAQSRSPIRALEILELIADEGAIGHSGIAARLDIPKSTASSLLKALLDAGYILRDQDKKFSLAPRLLRLSEGYMVHRHWLAPLLPLLDRLCEATNETVFLVERSGDHRVVVARRLVRNGLSYTVPTGDAAPLSGTAGGHALARASETLLNARGEPELVERSADGVVFAPSALVSGVVSFAIALTVPPGVPPLAFSLAMPDARLSASARQTIEAALVSARDSAQLLLGTAHSIR